MVSVFIGYGFLMGQRSRRGAYGRRSYWSESRGWHVAIFADGYVDACLEMKKPAVHRRLVSIVKCPECHRYI